jgi:hypothetical protein
MFVSYQKVSYAGLQIVDVCEVFDTVSWSQPWYRSPTRTCSFSRTTIQYINCKNLHPLTADTKIPRMADFQPQGLLTLATETQLEICRHVIISCIEARDLSELYLSCRTIHSEIKAFIVPKMKELLDIQHS